MRVVELEVEMELSGNEAINFDQLVRIFVDTDVDTHFIVSLSRTATVANLRELVKVTHRHCYPDSGDVDVGKLAVPGGDYGYHLADFLLIGQVYDRYDGKVFAEVKSHDPASNYSQGVFRTPTLSFKTGLTPKKVPLLAPQPFENVAGHISTNASGFAPLFDPRVSGGEPGAQLPVGSNLCEQLIELIEPKLQKEEIDEDGNCLLGSQEPLDGLPGRVRGLAVGSFERIVEEEDEKLVERPSTAVNDGGAETSAADLVPKLDQLNPNMCSADLQMKADKVSLGATHALSSDIQRVSRKRDASVSNGRPSKSRRLTGQTLRGNTSKALVENGRLKIANRNGAIEIPKDESSNPVDTKNIVNDVNAAASSHMNHSGDFYASYLSSLGSKRRKKKALPICDLTTSENRSTGVEDVMFVVEDKEEVCNEEIRKKNRQAGSDLVIGSGVEGSGTSGLEVGKVEKSLSLAEDAGVHSTLGQNVKKKREQKQEKELETEKTEKKAKKDKREKKEKKGKKVKKQKQEKEPAPVKEPEQEEEPEQEKKPEEEEEPELEKQPEQKDPKQEEPEQDKELEQKKTEKKMKKEKRGTKEKKQKRVKEPEPVKEPEQEEEPEQGDEPEKEEPVKEEPEQEITEKKVKKGEKEKKQKQELEQERTEKKVGRGKKEKKQKKERKQKVIHEITPLESASPNPLVEETDKEPEQVKGHSGATAVSPGLSQHGDHDEKDSDGDIPAVKKSAGVKRKGSTAAAAVAYDIPRRMGDEDLERPSASDFLKDEISESGTPQREAQMSRDTSGGGMVQNGAVATGLVNIDDKVPPPRTDLFGDVNDVETSPSYQDGVEASPETQGTKVSSVESQETPSPSKHFSCTRAGRGAPSQTRSIESSRDVTMGKQIGGRDTKTYESQSPPYLKKATQHSEGINLASEVLGAWLRRGMLDSEPEHIDQSQVAKPGKVTHSRSSTGESSAESDPRSADQTEAFHTNNISRSVKIPKKHASTSAKRTDGGDVITKNDSLEFFSQDQSFHVAPTQVEKALSGSTTEDSSDESDTDPVKGTDKLKQTASSLNTTYKGGDDSKESSEENLVTPGRRGFPSLSTRTPAPLVSRTTGNGGSQSFKRRTSGVAAEIEAKFAQFIESQGGLDEIMGITLGQRKRSMPVESSTQVGLGARSTASLATPFDSPLDLALDTQGSVKNSPMALDIAHASQNSAGNFFTPQFKVPKPVSIGTISGGVQGMFSSAATAVPLSGREVPKVRASKELRLKRKDSRTQVDKQKETDNLAAKHNSASLLPTLEPSKEPVLDDKDATEGKRKSAGNSNLLSSLQIPRDTFLDDLNAAEKSKSSIGKSSEKRKRLEEKDRDSQFMIINNTDHILEHEREVGKLGSDVETNGLSGINEDGSLVLPKKSGMKNKEGKVKKEVVETGVLGSRDLFVLDTSGRKKKRKKSEKEGTRKKKMKFLPEELDGKELNILPENSVERSVRETEERYVQLEKANRDLWLQNNSVSSVRKEEEKRGNRDYPVADLEDTEGADGEDVAQSRLMGRETEVGDSGNDKLKTVDDAPVHGGGAADGNSSPELCSGDTEASDREDSVFQSEDEKAETSQQDNFKPTDVFDYVSDDELPTKILSKSAMMSEMNEKRKAKRMEELSGRAVQRVLDDEMLHVAGTNNATSRKSRKDTKPLKWTVRVRGLSLSSLATSLHGGTVPSDATEFRSSPSTISKTAGGGAKVKREVADTMPRVFPRAAPVKKSTQSADEISICPVGCGKLFTWKHSTYYRHKSMCTGAPLD